MKATGKKILSSISLKVILLIIVLVLPMNISAIIESDMAMDTIIEHAELFQQGIADEKMLELNARRSYMNSILFYFYQADANFIAMRNQNEKNDRYKLSKIRF